MKATRRTSAPYSCAITIIAEAAPGEEPQAAVVPGSAPYLTSVQPTTPPAATVVATTSSISGQSRAMESRMSGVMLRATRQPTIPCAAVKDHGGGRNRLPPTPKAMARIIGPSNSAAGTATRSNSQPASSDSAASAAHLQA